MKCLLDILAVGLGDLVQVVLLMRFGASEGGV